MTALSADSIPYIVSNGIVERIDGALAGAIRAGEVRDLRFDLLGNIEAGTTNGTIQANEIGLISVAANLSGSISVLDPYTDVGSGGNTFPQKVATRGIGLIFVPIPTSANYGSSWWYNPETGTYEPPAPRGAAFLASYDRQGLGGIFVGGDISADILATGHITQIVAAGDLGTSSAPMLVRGIDVARIESLSGESFAEVFADRLGVVRSHGSASLTLWAYGGIGSVQSLTGSISGTISAGSTSPSAGPTYPWSNESIDPDFFGRIGAVRATTELTANLYSSGDIGLVSAGGPTGPGAITGTVFAASGDIGAITTNGWLSGLVEARHGSIGSVAARRTTSYLKAGTDIGSVTISVPPVPGWGEIGFAAAGGAAGDWTAGRDIGTVTVSGDAALDIVVGRDLGALSVGGAASLGIDAGRDIGSVSSGGLFALVAVAGGTIGSVSGNTGTVDLTSNTGSIGPVSASGDLVATIHSGGNLGQLSTAAGSLTADVRVSGNFSGGLSAAEDVIADLRVGGSVGVLESRNGTADFRIYASGGIAGIHAYGDLLVKTAVSVDSAPPQSLGGPVLLPMARPGFTGLFLHPSQFGTQGGIGYLSSETGEIAGTVVSRGNIGPVSAAKDVRAFVRSAEGDIGLVRAGSPEFDGRISGGVMAGGTVAGLISVYQHSTSSQLEISPLSNRDLRIGEIATYPLQYGGDYYGLPADHPDGFTQYVGGLPRQNTYSWDVIAPLVDVLPTIENAGKTLVVPVYTAGSALTKLLN